MPEGRARVQRHAPDGHCFYHAHLSALRKVGKAADVKGAWELRGVVRKWCSSKGARTAKIPSGMLLTELLAEDKLTLANLADRTQKLGRAGCLSRAEVSATCARPTQQLR